MKSVLIVDDDATVLLSIGVRLNSMGCTIAIVAALWPGDSWQPNLRSA